MKVFVDAVRARTRALLGGATWTALGPLGAAAIGKALGGGGPPPWLGLWLLVLVLAGWAVAGVAFRRASGRAADAEVEDAGLRLAFDGGATRAIAWAEIDSAMEVGAGPNARIELVLANGEALRLKLPSEDERSRLWEAIRAHGRSAASRFRLYSPGSRVLTQMGGGMLGLLLGAQLGRLLLALVGATFGGPLSVVLLLVGAIAGATLLGRTLPEIVVGADGLAYRRGFKKVQFVPYDELEGIRLEQRQGGKGQRYWAVVLSRRAQADEVLASFRGDEPEEATAFVRGVHQAIADRRGADGGASALDELEPGEDSIEAWLARVREIATRAADYRRSALTSERLLELVSSPTAGAAQRIGAAIVLRDRDKAGPRVRVAAEATANPKLRVALEAVAEADAAREADAVREALEDERAQRGEDVVTDSR